MPIVYPDFFRIFVIQTNNKSMKVYVILISVAFDNGYEGNDIMELQDKEEIKRLAKESERIDGHYGVMSIPIFENSFNDDVSNYYSTRKVYIKII